MTSEQIRLRILFDTAITRHYRSLLDAARTTPALLDDLVAVAETYATEHARRVTARQQLRAEAAAPVAEGAVVGYKVGDDVHHPSDVTVVRGMEPAAEPPATSSHRTRTRTRGGPK